MDGTQGSNYSSHPMVPLETVGSNGRRGDPNPSESPVPGLSPSTAPVSCDVLAASPYHHPAMVWRAGATRSLLALSSPLAPRQRCCGHTPVSGCIWLPRFRTYQELCLGGHPRRHQGCQKEPDRGGAVEPRVGHWSLVLLGTPERWWGVPLRCPMGLGQRAPNAATPTGGCVGSGWQQQWLLITLGGGQPSLGIGTPAERNLAVQAGSSGSSANRPLWMGSGSWGPQDTGGTFCSKLRELGPTSFRPVLPPGPPPLAARGLCGMSFVCACVYLVKGWVRDLESKLL